MKKILMVLGVVFVCLILVGAIIFSGYYYFTGKLDKESKAYVDEVVPIIVANWNSEELMNRASPEFLQATPARKIESLFGVFSKQIVPLKEYRGAAGRAKIKISPKNQLITADYIAEAVFEKATAKIKIRIVRRNGEWQIVGFLVQLEASMNRKFLINDREYEGR